jgi:uridine kinase
MARPFTIGIAGGSCAGKSELAASVAACLSRAPAPIVSLDAYYRDLTALSPSDRSRANFDHPDALDIDLLVAQLEVLGDGRSIETPIYDFTTHARSAARRLIHPAEFVIIEGLFTLHWEEVRRLVRFAVFVDTDEDTCLARRLRRDTEERGRTAQSVLEQWRTTVRPMFEQWVGPTRHFATLDVNGAEAPDHNAALVLTRISEGRKALSAR